MKFFGVLAVLGLLCSLSFAAEISRLRLGLRLAEQNARLEDVRQINDTQKPLEELRIDTENQQDELIGMNPNNVIDSILDLAKKAIVSQGYNEVALPQVFYGMNLTIWPFGEVPTGVELYDGKITGLQNLNRIGDATVKTEGSDIIFESTIGIVDTSFDYSLAVTFFDIGPRGSMSGQMEYAYLNFKIRMDADSKVMQFEEISVEKISPIQTDIQGLGFLMDILAEMIANVSISLFQGCFASAIAGPVKTILNEILDDMVLQDILF